MLVQLDNDVFMANSTSDDPTVTQNPVILYSADNLDPTNIHTLTVEWLSNGNDQDSYVYFDHLVVNGYSAVYEKFFSSSDED